MNKIEFTPILKAAALKFKCTDCGARLESIKDEVFSDVFNGKPLFYCAKCAGKIEERRAAERAAAHRSDNGARFAPITSKDISYFALVESMGYEIITHADEGQYQGDSFFLLRDKNRGEFGYLNFGWGSCSCCDALEGCESIADVVKLRDDLHTSIKWDSAKNMLGFMLGHDWAGDYNHSTTFVTEAILFLTRWCEKIGESPKS